MTYVFVPFSCRSYNGIRADVHQHYPDARVVPMVLDGEDGPPGMKSLAVGRNGMPGLFAAEKGSKKIVVANGGPTPLSVAAVLLAQRLGASLINVQWDSVTVMETDPSFD